MTESIDCLLRYYVIDICV